MIFRNMHIWATLFLCWVLPAHLFADTVVILEGSQERTLEGEILLEAQDQSMLFQKRGGELLILAADQIKSKLESEIPTVPLTADEIAANLLKELPGDFKIKQTQHYVIAYQTEDDYAKWISTLYEKKLYKAYGTFSKKLLKLEPKEPQYPLVAIVFGSKPEYERYIFKQKLQADLGDAPAFYNQMSNRVIMYDLTFDLGDGNGPKRKLREILSRKEAIPMVATVVHEATHQLMHNRGLQTRMADRPLWINEGLAIYFEAPNRKGWSRPGQTHHGRLECFRDYLAKSRPVNSIESLVANDQRFSGPGVLQAYAESWALVHFLSKAMPDKLASYLESSAAQPLCRSYSNEERLTEFEKHFGDRKQLEKRFIKYIRKLK